MTDADVPVGADTAGPRDAGGPARHHRDDNLSGHDPSAAFQAQGWRSQGRRALRRARELLGDDPRFLPIVLRLTPLGLSRRITDSTEVVIEGFPRSGNTFATFALSEAEGRTVEVASHVHVPAQVKVAVKLRKPTLLVVREPLGCITSLLTAAPHVRFEAAIKEYTHHHEELLAWRHGFVVGSFEQTTTDFASITDRLNDRFGTTFKPFVQTPENVDRVFARIDAHYREVYGDRSSERVVPRPSPARRAEKEWLTDQLRSSRYAELMAGARAVHDELVNGS